MIISLPDGKEVSLRWRGQVGQWEIALPKRESLWQRVNDAGLNWYFQMSQQKSDPHHATRCVRDYPWQCPYLQNGGHAPCIGKRKSDCDLKHKMSVWTRYALNHERTRYDLSARRQKSNVNLVEALG